MLRLSVARMWPDDAYPVIPGGVLDKIMDSNYRRTLLRAWGDFGDFLLGFITSSISLILTVALLLMLQSQTNLWSYLRCKISAGKTLCFERPQMRNQAANIKIRLIDRYVLLHH